MISYLKKSILSSSVPMNLPEVRSFRNHPVTVISIELLIKINRYIGTYLHNVFYLTKLKSYKSNALSQIFSFNINYVKIKILE